MPRSVVDQARELALKNGDVEAYKQFSNVPTTSSYERPPVQNVGTYLQAAERAKSVGDWGAYDRLTSAAKRLSNTLEESAGTSDDGEESWGQFLGGLGSSALDGLSLGFSDRLEPLNRAHSKFKKRHPYLAEGASIGGMALPMLSGVGVAEAVPALLARAAIRKAAPLAIKDVAKTAFRNAGMGGVSNASRKILGTIGVDTGRNANLLSKLALGSTEGALSSGIYGYNSPNEGMDRSDSAKYNAILGGVLGGALPVAGKAVSTIVAPLVRPLTGGRQAGKIVLDELEKAGISPSEVVRKGMGGEIGTLIEAGSPMERLAKTSILSSDDAARRLQEVSRGRMGAVTDDILADINGVIPKPKMSNKEIHDVLSEIRSKVGEEFNKFDKAAIPINNDVSSYLHNYLSSEPGIKSALAISKQVPEEASGINPYTRLRDSNAIIKNSGNKRATLGLPETGVITESELNKIPRIDEYVAEELDRLGKDITPEAINAYKKDVLLDTINPKLSVKDIRALIDDLDLTPVAGSEFIKSPRRVDVRRATQGMNHLKDTIYGHYPKYRDVSRRYAELSNIGREVDTVADRFKDALLEPQDVIKYRSALPEDLVHNYDDAVKNTVWSKLLDSSKLPQDVLPKFLSKPTARKIVQESSNVPEDAIETLLDRVNSKGNTYDVYRNLDKTSTSRLTSPSGMEGDLGLEAAKFMGGHRYALVSGIAKTFGLGSSLTKREADRVSSLLSNGDFTTVAKALKVKGANGTISDIVQGLKDYVSHFGKTAVVVGVPRGLNNVN